MMNLKRLGALSLSVVLALSALSGCKSGNDEGQSSSSSQTDASSSSVTQVEPMDLTGVTDPYLAAAGLAGDTVVATAGGAEITADSLLYWLTYGIDGSAQYYSMFGMGEMPWDTEVDGKTLEDALMDSALQTAALYALLPGLAEQEGAAASPDVDQRAEEALASMAKDSGGEEMLDHALWGSALTRDLFKQMMRVNDMNGQLQDKLYGEGTAGYPSDAQVLSYAQDEKGVYRAKHILLKTVDTDKPITDEDGNPTGEYEALDDAVVAEKKALAEDLLSQLQAAEDKEALFDAVDTVELCLPVFAAMVDTLTVRPKNMAKAAAGGFINATDCADYLVKKGLPFREAYMIVGRLVNLCIKTGDTLDTLTLKDFRAISGLFDEDVYKALELKTCVNGRSVYGGPARESVEKQISNIEGFLAQRS